MQKEINDQVVQHLINIAREFKREGDASHDGIIILHVKDTKGSEKEPDVIVIHNACACNFKAGINKMEKVYKRLLFPFFIIDAVRSLFKRK